jgi:hypothetical protein
MYFSSGSILIPLLGHVVEDEAVDVGVFLYLLRYRLAAAVTGLGVDTDEAGCVAGLAVLKGWPRT